MEDVQTMADLCPDVVILRDPHQSVFSLDHLHALLFLVSLSLVAPLYQMCTYASVWEFLTKLSSSSHTAVISVCSHDIQQLCQQYSEAVVVMPWPLLASCCQLTRCLLQDS